MGTKAQELIDGCFARAKDDEPLFVLRANDEAAPAMVDAWCTAYAAKHIIRTDPANNYEAAWDTPEAKAKHDEAMQCGIAMRKWKQQNP